MSFAAAVALRSRVGLMKQDFHRTIAVKALPITCSRTTSFAWTSNSLAFSSSSVNEDDESSSKRMSTADLVKITADTHKLTQAQSKRILNTIVDTITESLADNKTVALSGLGTFSKYESPARKGRNPSTQEPLQIPAFMRVRFRAGKSLKDTLNNRKKAKEDTKIDGLEE